MTDQPQTTTQRDPGPEEAACMLCGRTAEIEALADSCDNRACPLNALFASLPIVKERP